MRLTSDQRAVDQSALRMRAATIRAGVWLSYVVCGSSAVYVIWTWSRPNRLALALLFAAGVAGALVVSILPRERIVHSRMREAFFLTWSLVDLLLISLAGLWDGGTASPLMLTFVLPVVFAAMSYPLASVVAVGSATVAGYLSIAVAAGGVGWPYQSLFAVMLLCTGVMSAWMARNQERQRTALMEASRADPLTGCLNRRGFEERAIAEIARASRRAGEGAVLLLDLDRFKEVNDRQGHAAGDELLRWVVETLRVSVRLQDAIGRIGGDEFAVLMSDIDGAAAVESAARISRKLEERAPCTVGVATFPANGNDLEALMREADGRLYAARHGRPGSGRASADERLSWAATLAHAVDMRMNPGHDHGRAVAEHAVTIARALGWEGERLGMLRIAAMLHDVGKVAVPDSVLCKPGDLTPGERELVERDSVAGAELVARIEGLEAVVSWIRHAHERFDGGGYPDGLSAEEIPEASRIMLVAEAFDAITSARPYRAAMPVSHAAGELRRHAGSQFDPRCVRAMLDALEARETSGDSVAGAAGAG
jgi:diguanylate cyclase (GGDEF)-like protein